MKRKIEVELKYNILNPAETKKLDLRSIDKKKVVDVFYDTAGGELFKRGIFIRNRNDAKLDFKFNLEELAGKDFRNDHTHCDEYSFRLPLAPKDRVKFIEVCGILGINAPEKMSIENFLKLNKFVELVVVDKERTAVKKNGFEISIDKIAGLGSFIEVEKVVKIEGDNDNYKAELESLKQQIDKFVEGLGLKVKQNSTGYCELVLREQNFDLYKQGKYVLEEDE